MATTASAAERRDELVGRLFGAAISTLDLLSVYLGDRLDLYRTLRDRGPSTVAELAAAAGIHERYAQEWLEQQAATGILDVDDADADPGERRYNLPEGHGEALTDEVSLNFVAPFGRLLVGCMRPIEAVVEAFRTGGGVPYADYGEDLHEGQAQFSRPTFEKLLGQEWLPAAPAVHARLQADPPARVADLACGQGRSSIAIARAYPKVHVDGIDLDLASIEAARLHLPGSGVEDRVAFHHRDAAEAEFVHHYDLVTIFEALHDMSYPVDVLETVRGMLADGGAVFVADERAADSFAAPADDYERFLYGFSVVHCLPVGMVGESAAGTGTVMRASTVRRYAAAAGFSGVELLPIENDFFRCYLLTP